MDTNNWNGLMKVLEIWSEDPNGMIVWKRENLLNTLHLGGEQFILTALFTGGQNNMIIPANFFLGLDNRSTVASTDDMTNLTNEPINNGYSRQSISAVGGFTVVLSNGAYQANTAIATFRSNGQSWGPVSNLFLTTASDNSGYLISTAPLGAPFSVPAGNTVSLRLGLSLQDC